MGSATTISWTDASWNPVRGCSRISEGCRNCYAERVAARFSDEGQPYHGFADRSRAGSKWTGVVNLIPEHLADPLRWKKPRRIFVSSTSDVFHESLSNEHILAIFGVMASARRHTFQVLTKRAKRMREWFAWAGCLNLDDLEAEAKLACGEDRDYITRGTTWPLPNVWLGTSVENQAAADERIPELLATPATIRFLSCEPLIGALDLERWIRRIDHCTSCLAEHAPQIPDHCPACRRDWTLISTWGDEQAQLLRDGERHSEPFRDGCEIDWVIAGCESGPGARPCDVAWLRSLRDQCDEAGTAFFLKQAVATDNGRCGDADNPNGDDPCGKRIRVFVNGPDDGSWSCGCTHEGPEFGGAPELGEGEGSSRKGRGVIELPYLDGAQHAAFPSKESP